MKRILLFTGVVLLLFSCKKDTGTISITYKKAQAVYGDLEAIRKMPIITVQQPIENPGKIYIGEDYVLVGEEGKGIHIFDNADMTNPQRISFIQIPYNKEFFVKNNMLYAESLYDFIKVNITNVYQPQLVSRAKNVFGTPYTNDKGESLIRFDYTIATDNFELNSPEAKELKKQGKIHLDYLNNLIPVSAIPSSFTNTMGGAGTLNRIAAEFNHIYVLGGSTLHVILDGYNKISHVEDVELGEGMETIYAENNRLYIGSQTSMLIYSVSTPSKPTEVSTFTHTRSCDPVLPNGNIAYMTLRTSNNAGCNDVGENTLTVIDISNEQEPQSVKVINMLSPYGMTMLGWYLVVGEGTNGLAIFDASNPSDPVEVSRTNSLEAYDVMRHPSNPFILMVTSSNGLEQYQIDYNDFSLTPLSTINY